MSETGLQPGQRLLEIGWLGALAETAVEFGAQTGVTLSREQLQWGMQRITQAGLQAQVDLRYQDYRDLATEHAAQPLMPLCPSRCSRLSGMNTGVLISRHYATASSPAATLACNPLPCAKTCLRAITHSTDFIQQFISRAVCCQRYGLRARGPTCRPDGGKEDALWQGLCRNAKTLAS
ncbi:class I SAM-dependent methyltransferase, partial [Staphylococcus epidermidis]|nr:class I SAM-dependent methyltransferase [Staphylococcus epidermidis]